MMDDDFPAEFGVYQHVKKAHPHYPTCLWYSLINHEHEVISLNTPNPIFVLRGSARQSAVKRLTAYMHSYVFGNVRIPISRRIFSDQNWKRRDPSHFQPSSSNPKSQNEGRKYISWTSNFDWCVGVPDHLTLFWMRGDFHWNGEISDLSF